MVFSSSPKISDRLTGVMFPSSVPRLFRWEVRWPAIRTMVTTFSPPLFFPVLLVFFLVFIPRLPLVCLTVLPAASQLFTPRHHAASQLVSRFPLFASSTHSAASQLIPQFPLFGFAVYSAASQLFSRRSLLGFSPPFAASQLFSQQFAFRFLFSSVLSVASRLLLQRFSPVGVAPVSLAPGLLSFASLQLSMLATVPQLLLRRFTPFDVAPVDLATDILNFTISQLLVLVVASRLFLRRFSSIDVNMLVLRQIYTTSKLRNFRCSLQLCGFTGCDLPLLM